MEINGTTYSDKTSREIVNVLESCRLTQQRIRVFYGDTDTGRDWGEEFGTMGYVSRSTGKIKIPILVHNSRSLGGSPLLDGCIVRIMDTRTHRELYRHPQYHRAGYRIGPLAEGLPPEYEASVWALYENGDWDNVANFRSYDQAERWVRFMAGKRMSK